MPQDSETHTGPGPQPDRGFGRFAPSPTGDLHLGNLRTAMLAWLAARASGRGFLVRVEDLDRVSSSTENQRRQLSDLQAIGLDWDAEPVVQSERFALYQDVIEQLTKAGAVYPCFCTRREIQAEIAAATSAPHHHLPDGAYPGTCRDLTEDEQRQRGASGRRPALRLRTDGEVIGFEDRIAGWYEGAVDDVVLARADGVPAYNLAVVVDDAAQNVTQVLRGDDLLSSTPRQILLQSLINAPHPEYLHVPLLYGPDGQRLAKRHGAVTLADARAADWDARRVVTFLATSCGLATRDERVTVDMLIERFDPTLVSAATTHWTGLDPDRS